MPQFPVFSGKKLIKGLIKMGYRIVRQRGSHVRLECRGKKSVTVPDHKTIGRGLLLKILRDAEIDPQEFLAVLKSK